MKTFFKIHSFKLLITGIILLHFFFLSQTVFWPYQEFRIYPYLTSQGMTPYKEIIDQHFPGLFFLPINLYSLGLATPSGLRLLQYVLIVVTYVLICKISKRLYTSNHIVVFACLIYMVSQILFEGYVLWIDSFVSPLVLYSYYLLMKSKTPSKKLYFLSGFFLALAMFFKQLVIVVFLTVLTYHVLTKVSSKKIISFFFGFITPLLLLFLYILKIGVLQEFLYWTFTFNKTIYPEQFFRLPTVYETLLLAFIIVPTFIVILHYYKRTKQENRHLLIPFAVPLPILLYGTWAFIHIQPFLAFAAITFSSVLVHGKKKYIQLFAISYLVVMVLLSVQHVYKLGKSNTFIDENVGELVQAIKRYDNEGKSVYIHKFNPELYQLTHTIPAIRLYVPNYPWYTVVLEDKLLISLQRRKPDVIITSGDTEDNSRIGQFIQSSYLDSEVINGVTILKKK